MLTVILWLVAAYRAWYLRRYLWMAMALIMVIGGGGVLFVVVYPAAAGFAHRAQGGWEIALHIFTGLVLLGGVLRCVLRFADREWYHNSDEERWCGD
ncbi:MAG: hypothetical protein ACLFU8_08305 [Anaerolineales bacterium]